MKKTLFVVLGLAAAGLFLSADAKAQAATSDLWCEEAPAGTPVCNVNANWANRRKQLGVDEVCCVWKEQNRGNKGNTGAKAPEQKPGKKVVAKEAPKAKPEPKVKPAVKPENKVKPAPKAQPKTTKTVEKKTAK